MRLSVIDGAPLRCVAATHAERDREHGRQHEGGQRQLGGGRPECSSTIAHGRAPLADGEAEVAARDGGDEVDVLHVERAVEAEQVPGVRDLLPGGGLVHEKRGGIAGEPDEEEDDGDDAPDDEDARGSAAAARNLAASPRHFLSATPRKSMFSSCSRREAGARARCARRP